MKLLELMLALNKHYPDDRILMAIDQETGEPLPFQEQVEQTGDTLAVFLVNEISTAIEGSSSMMAICRATDGARSIAP